MAATVSKKIVLLLSLIASGFLLCATDADKEEIKGRGTKEIVIGIHLGTTYSSVAVFKDPPPTLPRGRICHRRDSNCKALTKSDILELVPDELGRLTTPSCVTFTASGGVVIGELAKNQSAFEGTICGSNRLIGKRFDDPDVQLYIKTLPYNVVNVENKPRIKVNFEDGSIGLYSPETICSHILWRMKQIAETYTRNKVAHAVVLIHPCYYNDVVSEHIIAAGKIAGLEVVYVKDSRLMRSLARRPWIHPDWKVLVYHLGSTATHVRLYNNPDETIGPIAASGDANLGGQTLETRVVDYFINLIKNKYKKDISKNSSAMGKLRIECEKAKISLSSRGRVMVNIEFVDDDGIFLFEEPLTRAMFEELNMDLFNRMFDLVRDVINEGGIEFNKGVDDIILVGGNTQIPKIQHMSKELLDSEPLKEFKPYEAMAFAATDVAAIFGNTSDDGDYAFLIFNSLTVGIETVGGLMAPYVGSNMNLPTSASGYVTTCYDGQTTVEIKVFEGERPLTKYCHHLVTLVISDLPPAPRGVVRIKLDMEVDINWNIRVRVEHKESEMIETIIIPNEWRHITAEQVNRAHLERFNLYEEDVVEKTEVQQLSMQQSYNTKFAIVGA